MRCWIRFWTTSSHWRPRREGGGINAHNLCQHGWRPVRCLHKRHSHNRRNQTSCLWRPHPLSQNAPLWLKDGQSLVKDHHRPELDLWLPRRQRHGFAQTEHHPDKNQSPQNGMQRPKKQRGRHRFRSRPKQKKPASCAARW